MSWGCATPEPAPVAEAPQAEAPKAEEPKAQASPPAPPARELPFEPSEGDKAAFEITGYVGVRTLPPDAGFAKGPIVAGVKPGGGAEKAGIREKDVVVEFAGVSFPADEDDPVGKLRNRLLELPFDSDTQVKVWREVEGVRDLKVHLGRRPPPFNSLDTPADWLAAVEHDDAVANLITDAIALDHGEARYADVVARNRKHLAKTDSFRLKEATQAHLDLAANEGIAREITDLVSSCGTRAASIAAQREMSAVWDRGSWGLIVIDGPPDGPSVETLGEAIATYVVSLDTRCRQVTSAWTTEERRAVATDFAKLAERINEGEYLYDDPKVERERASRRLVKLLAKADRTELARNVVRTIHSDLAAISEMLVRAASAAGRDGMLFAKDTPAGRIEIWGRGNTRHTERTAFCFDLGGNDDWLDCAGRADLDHPVSITIDWDGNDTYGGTSPFNEGGALGGVGILWDHAGDDQYLARTWSQGCGVAGFGLLQDDGGRDVYHGQDECQGVGFAGAGVLVDGNVTSGRSAGMPPVAIRRRGDDADLYTGARFCQGVGFPGGVGAVIDKGGDDRWVCTGRYDSEYGEPGLFSGFGQGVGFGFRNIASGGIGVLYDLAGDDVYEAGNFSQGGGYSYAWGILRDDAGDDRYIGSRYAQGFAAHQAVGTFLEGGGNDLYQSHSTVACGLSWDETSVVFHDVSGDDVYEQGGFSLASAAQNGMVLFLDDAGNDRYADLPAHAANNEYHGGKSFALFVDGGGDDVYGSEKPDATNGKSECRDEGAYFVDR
jgi:hypothetical protein